MRSQSSSNAIPDASERPAPARGRVRIVLVCVLLLLVAGALALIFWPKGKVDLAPTPPASVQVFVQDVAATNIGEEVVFTGRVEAEKDLHLAVDDNGRILWVGADQGDRVSRGQLLLRLDDAAATAAVARAEISLRQAEDDLGRWAAMKEAGAVSVHDYETVRNRRDMARIALEEAVGMLDKRRVSSPVDGVVNRRYAEVGEMAMPGKPAFQVVQTDRVKVVVDIPERDAGSIQPGMPLAFTVDALGGRVCTGEVVFVAVAADPASLTFRTELIAGNAGNEMKPGMIARVRVTGGVKGNAVVVPLQALIPDQGQYVAFVVVEERAVRRVVKLASVTDTLAIVDEGLQPGDRIIVAGQRKATDGVSVKVNP